MTHTDRTEDIKSLVQFGTHVLDGTLPLDANWPWFNTTAPGTWTTRTITISDVLVAIDEYLARKEQS